MARAAHAFAIANPRVSAEIVEASEFPEVSRRYGVMGVPKTVINERTEFVGAVADETFVNAVLEAIGREPVDWDAEFDAPERGEDERG